MIGAHRYGSLRCPASRVRSSVSEISSRTLCRFRSMLRHTVRASLCRCDKHHCELLVTQSLVSDEIYCFIVWDRFLGRSHGPLEIPLLFIRRGGLRERVQIIVGPCVCMSPDSFQNRGTKSTTRPLRLFAQSLNPRNAIGYDGKSKTRRYIPPRHTRFNESNLLLSQN